MTSANRVRVIVALCFALSSVAAFAAPASAETILVNCVEQQGSGFHGTCGDWQVGDGSVGQKGASGSYATSYPYELNKISVRPPLMHGNYTTETKVGWRFQIQRKNVNGGSWNTIYTSSYQTAKADDQIPAYAGNGFTRRAWSAPNDPSGYWYRVIIEMQWWNSGSVEGYTKIKYDWYKAKRGSDTTTYPNYLIASY